MIIPAIDLMNGQCVRLHQGDFKQRTSYEVSPIDVAKTFADEGAEWLHIVDLDGARSQSAQQTQLIIDIANSVPMKVQTGGGVRDLATIIRLLDGGLDRVVVGSTALKQPHMVQAWMREVGPEKIVIALDVNFDEDGVPFPTSAGWTEQSSKSLWDILDVYSDTGLDTILVTDISRDGVLGGSNVALYNNIQLRYPGVDLITSGGVGTLDHVKELKSLNPHGIIIGKALYENKFRVSEAIAC